MQLGFAGLGRMGANMVTRLRQRTDIEIVAFDPSPQAREAVNSTGTQAVDSLAAVVEALRPPRNVWLMVPAGEITEKSVDQLVSILQPGDTIVDGGNSNFHDTLRRAAKCREAEIHFVDAGTSGGVWGLKNGYCLMVGGDDEAVQRLEPVFLALAPPDGYLHVGPSGAGHYVKMVHNGIEYGMLQAYAEGFDILASSELFPKLDLGGISHLWNQGSVVRSWLLELAEAAFSKEPRLENIRGWVADSGEGRWTLEEALDLNVPAPVLAASLFARYQSRRSDGFGNKVIAALRNEFGGHAVKSE